MAIKIVVSYSNLHLSVSSQEIASLATTASTSTLLSYQYPVLNVNYVDLTATNVLLNADTKNLYFSSQYDSPQVQIISMSESLELEIERFLSDSLSFIDDDLVKSLQKSVSDAVSFSDDIIVSVIYFRDFTDSYSVGDQLNSLAIGIGKEDATTITEDLTKQLSTTKEDLFSVSEAASLSTGLEKTDSVSMSEVFSRTVIFNRSFSDAITLDDLASATDPLQTDSVLDKTNIATVTDQLVYSAGLTRTESFSFLDVPEKLFTTNKADSLNIAESLSLSYSTIASDSTSLSDIDVISFSKSLADSTTITESISISLVAGAQGLVLNEARLNTNVLN